MVAPFLAAALSLVEMAPALSRWFKEDKSDPETTKMIASHVLKIAKQVTGEKSAASAVESLKTNPKALLEFQRSALKMDYEIHQSFIKDRVSARQRDIALITGGRISNKRADIMVISAAVGLILCLGFLAFYKNNMPGEAVGIISTIAGIFGACLKDAYAFEFGSSRGSKEKDLAFMMNALNEAKK